MNRAKSIVANSLATDFANTIKQTIKLHGQNPDEKVEIFHTEPVVIEALSYSWEVECSIESDKKPNGDNYIQSYFKAPRDSIRSPWNSSRNLLGTAIKLNEDFTPIIEGTITTQTVQDTLDILKSLNAQILAKQLEGKSSTIPNPTL